MRSVATLAWTLRPGQRLSPLGGQLLQKSALRTELSAERPSAIGLSVARGTSVGRKPQTTPTPTNPRD